jgi:hypothetical protein
VHFDSGQETGYEAPKGSAAVRHGEGWRRLSPVVDRLFRFRNDFADALSLSARLRSVARHEQKLG